jgi:hypothetical protein
MRLQGTTEVNATLSVSAGARVEPQWLEADKVRNGPAMLAALGFEG